MPEETNGPTAQAAANTSSAANTKERKPCAHEGCNCRARRGGNLYCSDYCAGEPKDKQTGCLCGDEDCLKECDLIMKGGITSGIVYPPLVIKLSRKYRFRNVGGTSAGAIAAAVTAAAEHGRRFGGLGSRAFKQLNAVKDWLGQGSHLRDLFQPTPKTRPLLDIFLYFSDERRKGWNKRPWEAVKTIRRALKERDAAAFEEGSRELQMSGHAVGFGAALALSVISILFYYLLAVWVQGRTISWMDVLLPMLILIVAATAFAGFAGNWAGGIVGSGKHLYRIITQDLKENLFGICDGVSGDRPFNSPPLTEWLDRQINILAGLPSGGEPLTFGQLWRQEKETDKKQIDLTMVTSNLSQAQPYILPFEGTLFLFNVKEFEELFPPNVMKHMTKHSSAVKEIKTGPLTTRYTAPEGYCFLPEAKDFPVIIATRMSLSFPVLISAIPLYTIMLDKELIEAQRSGHEVVLQSKHMQKNLFSDGGICSNFPIHFFDSWLPRRPTFGVNLTSLPENKLDDYEPESKLKVSKDEKKKKMEVPIDNYSLATEQAAVEISSKGKKETEQAVFLPGIRDEVLPTWVDIPSLPRFLGEIFNIAQNYRDNTQALLPGYRERIVSIALSDKEGGLNLEMDSDIIKEVVTKGEMAGDKLLQYFKFEQHQWVRFRVLVRELERNLVRMKEVIADEPPAFDYHSLIEQQRREELFFPSKQGWGDDVAKLLDAVRAFMRTEGWTNHLGLMKEAPYPVPEPKLRVTPNI
ncbi:MAG: patatin-like phospholipase family protein [Pyrinomonadaceae bacterium]|nr:patatin-like phospholipase family protein [Pyrinomonadaceae bacterium]